MTDISHHVTDRVPHKPIIQQNVQKPHCRITTLTNFFLSLDIAVTLIGFLASTFSKNTSGIPRAHTMWHHRPSVVACKAPPRTKHKQHSWNESTQIIKQMNLFIHVVLNNIIDFHYCYVDEELFTHTIFKKWHYPINITRNRACQTLNITHIHFCGKKFWNTKHLRMKKTGWLPSYTKQRCVLEIGGLIIIVHDRIYAYKFRVERMLDVLFW